LEEEVYERTYDRREHSPYKDSDVSVEKQCNMESCNNCMTTWWKAYFNPTRQIILIFAVRLFGSNISDT
jgi:hypothetical protein